MRAGNCVTKNNMQMYSYPTHKRTVQRHCKGIFYLWLLSKMLGLPADDALLLLLLLQVINPVKKRKWTTRLIEWRKLWKIGRLTGGSWWKLSSLPFKGLSSSCKRFKSCETKSHVNYFSQIWLHQQLAFIFIKSLPERLDLK